MSTLLALTENQPADHLAPGDVLISEGDTGGNLFVLVAGELVVSRGGVELATLTQPGTMVGEMAVLLNKPASATVRAGTAATVRTLRQAAAALESQPQLAYYVAGILAGRLDATSALLVEASRQEAGKAQPGVFARLLKALHTSDAALVDRQDLFTSTLMWPIM